MFSNSLHHPICNSIVGVDIYDLPNDGCTRSSNYSWLLMNTSHYYMCFFNPFTNVKVELPRLAVAGPLYGFSFSAPPTSPDCTIFCMTSFNYGKINFFILKRGEEEWTVREFDRPEDYDSYYCDSLLYKGNYYCLGGYGDLVIYDVEKDGPRWINSATTFLQNRLSNKRCQSFMAESDGELLAVFMSCDGEWVQVCKLDESRMIWVPVHNLGDKTLFISHPATFAETISVRGNTGNKIYMPWFNGNDNKCLFYSLDTRKYHCFGSSRSYKTLYGLRRPSSNTWIKPMSDLTCNSPFTW
ncbi:F-box/kelch-repeat protein At1g57790-like [Lycium barbarum]|uniref:F-box/kelch-repeat protein At1g57790-like n=1 Tax=Lycium barbarum TaxID=112863 RepID=UPI00293ED084|nr:F-box/kelch-repeat protein At1g57790-like [Lycium barbarum]